MYRHCQGESIAWWEVGTQDCCGARWLRMHHFGTFACFAVQLQTERHQAWNLLIDISQVSSWLKDSKSNVSHLVCVHSLRGVLLLFGFWSIQERQGGCKDMATLEREDGVLCLLQATGWVLLGLNLPRTGVTLGSSIPGQMERRKGTWTEDHQGRGHLEYQKVLEPLMTGAMNRGGHSAFTAWGSPVAGSHRKHRLCHVAGGWIGSQRGAQAKPLWGGQNCRSSLCFIFTLPMTTYCRNAEHSPFLMLNSLCSVLYPSEIFWLIILL